ncbi:hypothetical protein ACH5RR_040745 [Cinchona calisaya]|uniref:Uncharacterized protein n=1 Tax=Cinchona calisaya TaxID=153742 RepID=A0ABD2XSV1_9GENT
MRFKRLNSTAESCVKLVTKIPSRDGVDNSKCSTTYVEGTTSRDERIPSEANRQVETGTSRPYQAGTSAILQHASGSLTNRLAASVDSQNGQQTLGFVPSWT